MHFGGSGRTGKQQQRFPSGEMAWAESGCSTWLGANEKAENEDVRDQKCRNDRCHYKDLHIGAGTPNENEKGKN